MILQILSYIGWFFLYAVGLLLCIGCIIALLAAIDYVKMCKKMDSEEHPQDLKKEIKHFTNTNPDTKNTNEKSSTYARGFFGKLHDFSVIGLWVVVYSLWFVAMFVVGFFGLVYNLITDCFNRNKVIH